MVAAESTLPPPLPRLRNRWSTGSEIRAPLAGTARNENLNWTDDQLDFGRRRWCSDRPFVPPDSDVKVTRMRKIELHGAFAPPLVEAGVARPHPGYENPAGSPIPVPVADADRVGVSAQ
jgi:hypothetical protein